MEIEEFSLGNSFIHKMDPRVKIIAAFVFSVVVALNNSISACAVSLVFPLILIAVARISIARVLFRLAVVNGFILFLWLFLPFTHPGETIYSIGPLEVHREGVLYALLITLKSNAIILAVIALLGTSQVFTLVHALSHMGVPDKLVHLFFFCFRYVHVIHVEYHKLLNAIRIRGFRPGTNLHTYRTYAYLVGMLLVKSFDRSRSILRAMRCRGFKEKFYILHHYEMKRLDYLLAAWSALSCGVILIVR
ncbi:MAG: cobalt ECF transporter T component CbiQ [Desulfomonile tiedjei]|nr:cobalt ECF transporter T component CbiQ [Desulfomonile tiedjei]